MLFTSFEFTTPNDLRLKKNADAARQYLVVTADSIRLYYYYPKAWWMRDDGLNIIVSKGKKVAFILLTPPPAPNYTGDIKKAIFVHSQSITDNPKIYLMPNNLTAGLNVIVAKQNTPFANTGLNAANCEIIYEVGQQLRSWQPGRAINPITGFVKDKGYYVVMKTDADLTGLVVPPIVVDVTVNTPPVVSAGPAQMLTPGATSATLAGSATDNGTIVARLWTRESGPNVPSFATPTNATTNVTGLIPGSYVFRLTATDDKGLTGSATVTVTVSAAVQSVLNVQNLRAAWDVKPENVVKTGTIISQITDQSGNGNHLTTISGVNQPTFVDGANQYAQFGSANRLRAALNITGAVTIYVVAQAAWNTENNETYIKFDAVNGGRALVGQQSTLTKIPSVRHSGFNGFVVPMNNISGYDMAAPDVIQVVLNGANSMLRIGDELPSYRGAGVSDITQFEPADNIKFYAGVVVAGVPTTAEHELIIAWLKTKYPFERRDYIVNFGDSVTAGENATDKKLGWAYLAANETGKRYRNYGQPGTYLRTGSAGDYPVYKHLSQGAKHGWLTLSYGLNNDYTPNPSLWQTTLINNINEKITEGYDPSKIILVIPPPAPTRESYLPQLRDTYLAAAAATGVKTADTYTHIKALGNINTYIDADGLHPINAGHREMANVVKNTINGVSTVNETLGSWNLTNATNPNGAFAANALTDFTHVSGSRVNASHFTFNAVAKTPYLKGKFISRDQEAEFGYASSQTILLRHSDEGALVLWIKFGSNMAARLGWATPSKLALGYPEYTLYKYWDNTLDEAIAALGAGNGSGKFVFGVKGFEVYLTYNGLDLFREKHNQITKPGVAGLQWDGEDTAMIDGFKITNLTRVAIASDFDAGIINTTDLGAMPLQSVGSMSTADPYKITGLSTEFVNKVPIGAMVLIEIGGEPTVNGFPAATKGHFKGVGGVHPEQGRPTLAQLQQFIPAPGTGIPVYANGVKIHDDYQIAYVEDTGKVYGYYSANAMWFEKGVVVDMSGRPHVINGYITHAVPKSHRGRVTAKSGTTLTIDAPCKNSTTNANVYFDNFDPIYKIMKSGFSSPKTVYTPAGTYAISERIRTLNFVGCTFKGAGKTQTIFKSPKGCPSIALVCQTAHNTKWYDFGLVGCGTKQGFGFDWKGWDTDGDNGYNGLNPIQEPNAESFYHGLTLSGNNVHVKNVNFTDAYTAAFEFFLTNSLVQDCFVYHSTGVYQYMAWQIVVPGGGHDVIFDNVNFEAVEIVSALEAFGTTNVTFRNFTCKNGRISCNSGFNMNVENGIFTVTDGAAEGATWCSLTEPIASWNTNAYDTSNGGGAKNLTFIHEGYAHRPLKAVLRGININDKNENVLLKDCEYIVAESIRSAPQTETVGFMSTGKVGIVFDGLKCYGHNLGNAVDNFNYQHHNIAIANGIIKNCRADSILVETDVNYSENNVAAVRFKIKQDTNPPLP